MYPKTTISKTKGFRYPPVLPIIYYEGAEEWTAAQELKERVFLSDALTEYIPNFKCVLVKLRDYSNSELMEHEDELSVVMMINKLQKAADFKQLGSEIGPEYLKSVTAQSPEYLLNIISMVIRILLLKIKVPDEEVEAFVEQVKERRMGELFANFEEYDVQETRRLAREEARQELREEMLQLVQQEVRRETQQEAISKAIRVVKELTNSKEAAVEQLVKQYGLSEADAKEKVESNW